MTLHHRRAGLCAGRGAGVRRPARAWRQALARLLGGDRAEGARFDAYQKRFANPFVAAERDTIDEVILPRNTRRRICRELNMLRNKQVETPWKKHDNIPL